MERPRARNEGLLTEELDGELLVYDETSDVACLLNPTASLVWRSSDGTRTVPELVEIVAAEHGDMADQDMVLMALDTLLEHDLIASGYAPRELTASLLSRRRFFRRARAHQRRRGGRPIVYSMTVPSAAAAQSLPYTAVHRQAPRSGRFSLLRYDVSTPWLARTSSITAPTRCCPG